MLVSMAVCPFPLTFFFFNDTATTEIYTLSLHDALPICPFGEGQVAGHHECRRKGRRFTDCRSRPRKNSWAKRSEEHTSELQSLTNLVCRLLLEKKKRGNFHILQVT